MLSLPKAVRAKLGGMRGPPDVSYNADPNTAVLIYVGFFPSASGENGYQFVGGTSEGSPCWAGIVADLNQYAGKPLGFLNTALYAVGGLGLWSDVGRDITVGNNAFAGVAGYAATPGWIWPAAGEPRTSSCCRVRRAHWRVTSAAAVAWQLHGARFRVRQ